MVAVPGLIRRGHSVYGMTGEDSLSFVHTTVEALSRRRATTVPASQIAINGVLLDRLLVSLNLDDGAAPPDTLDMMCAPLQMDLSVEHRVAFLKALRGDRWSTDDLQPGRVPVAFCAVCGNSSCGHIWSVALTMSPSTVV
ncbi:hypothetical protein B7495_18655 (plasmid) [Cryobacterium sp. LW097]|nr:hypothetical protein B7495_17920 [Cryobacterium sp. LW097]ASD24292.1 hypothetical protein B7495_18655 [Cryobacterium sp. LW097]